MSAGFAESSRKVSTGRFSAPFEAPATSWKAVGLPTSIRIALLAAILALAANVAVIGFIHWRTYDESVATLRRR